MSARGWRRLTLNRRVMVTLKTGESLAGVVTREVGGLLTLTDAVLYDTGRSPLNVDGETIIDLDNVAFAQLAAPRTDPPRPRSTEE